MPPVSPPPIVLYDLCRHESIHSMFPPSLPYICLRSCCITFHADVHNMLPYQRYAVQCCAAGSFDFECGYLFCLLFCFPERCQTMVHEMLTLTIAHSIRVWNQGEVNYRHSWGRR